MKILKESILNEEDFEDVQADEFEDQQPENADELSDDGEESNTNDVEEPVEDTAGEDAPENTEPVTDTTVWKVKFKLGNNENWSRVTTETKEEAESKVRGYIVKKWPDREFEILNIEKYIEEELSEQLNESAITDAQPIENAAAVGMATVVSDLIKDEYEAIDNYNGAIATAEAEGFTDIVKVLTEIQAEEQLHIGQLQAIMNTLDPNAHLVDDGQQEGIEQLSNPIETNESLNENFEVDTNSMSPREYKIFRKVVAKHYGSVTNFFNRLHAWESDIEVNKCDIDEVPNLENCITLDSSDLSQGTGNVMSYIVMNPDDGKIYMYADF